MDRKAWIVITLCVIGMGINAWWMVSHPAAPQVTPAQPVATEPRQADPGAPSAPSATPGVPSVNAGTTVAATPEKTAELKNEKAAYTFTTKGGGISEVLLLDTKDHVRLNTQGKAAIGAISTAAKSFEDSLSYRIVDQTSTSIVFEADTTDQVRIRKAYSFSTGPGANDHFLNFKITLTNLSNAKLSKDSYFIYTGAASELRPDEITKPGFCWNNGGDPEYKDATAFRTGSGFLGFGGPILDYQGSYNSFRWAGVMSRFYATLISNKEDQPSRVWAEPFHVDHSKDEFKDHPLAAEDRALHGGFSLPPAELEPNVPKIHDLNIYLGPKIYRDLKQIDSAEGRKDRQLTGVMFYGWFGWISRILVWALRAFHDLTGNWGVAIILLTIAVRSLLWPLQARSNAQMKRMGKLSPMLKDLQAKYKDDQQRFAQEQMKLFKEYGVNPLGGCLPLLIQFPIFIAFFSVLRYATELRGQPFVAWVKDLSLPDTVATFNLPFHIPLIGGHFDVNPLPILMGVTMFLQMKLTPQPATVDPMQRRIFMLMPFMFLWFCYTYASALALYWTFTNIFMIVQAQITRALNKDDDAPLKKINPGGGDSGGGGGGGWGAPKGPASPLQPGQKKKKDKPGPPRPGGGGARSTRPKDS